MIKPALLVCDLDNTLYDWVSYFVSSFYAMVDTTVDLLGCDRETLLNDLRAVHQRHHDSEHPFSLLETDTIIRYLPDKTSAELVRILNPAFHAFNSSRKKTLESYPDVHNTLRSLENNGVILIAHTESTLLAAADRLRRLNLSQYFSRIYCRVRTSSKPPAGINTARWLEDFPMEKVVELSHHQRKPDSTVLLEICADIGVVPSQAAYIGDSMARDVLMANNADVFAIWAAYGSRHGKNDYEKLVRVSHWSSEDVAREKNLMVQAQHVKPDYIAEHGLCDLLELFSIKTEGSTSPHLKQPFKLIAN